LGLGRGRFSFGGGRWWIEDDASRWHGQVVFSAFYVLAFPISLLDYHLLLTYLRRRSSFTIITTCHPYSLAKEGKRERSRQVVRIERKASEKELDRQHTKRVEIASIRYG